jgi:alkanesulfonate monooxygenase SsuD/methylene tetrahydromethanopterin reductase-like flavin-dependent oxidoreductase (luciferase family)
VPVQGEPLQRMGFLTIGLFDEHDPAAGHEETLRTIEQAEQLGFDSVWLRDRHLQFGISSPVAVLAAATQRTSRIELGTAVIPLGPENPFRLAEDLATVDLLSHGRLNPGVSVGTPMGYETYKRALYPDTAELEDFGKTRVLRLLDHLRGEPVSSFEGTVGIEQYSRRIQPHSPGLAGRVWYGGGRDSATWAGEQGLNYLTSSVVSAAGTGYDGTAQEHFGLIQAGDIDAFRTASTRPDARVSQGLVVIPTDSATPAQREKYAAYAASRFERTKNPVGPRGMLFSPDLVGPSAELAERLWAHPGFQRVSEVAFALPFTFDEPDYRQIIGDLAAHLGPALGWTPKG